MELTLSVIIPTYNRSLSLKRLLDSLSAQSYPYEGWEAIIVDDGSVDPGYDAVLNHDYPFKLHTIYQANQGAAQARNAGATQSEAKILIFLDDDIVVQPDFLVNIVQAHRQFDRAMIMGTFLLCSTGEDTPFRWACIHHGIAQSPVNSGGKVSFLDCVSHNLSIKRQDFFQLGMFQDPTFGKGWPNWDDIDLSYRAYLQGFDFQQVAEARGQHIDQTLDDFQVHCKRAFRAGKSAASLFRKYPGLAPMMPMFRDKTAIDIKNDPPKLVLRKTLRAFLAWWPVLNVMETLTRILEKFLPRSFVLVRLYRWINSSYIYKGYRCGLEEDLIAGAH
jgi:glycosyltransferase involved in cell wall biosynthesis